MGKKSNPSGATPSIHEQLVELLRRLGDRAIAEKEARHIHAAMLAVSRGHDIGRDDAGFYARQRHTKLVGPAKELRDLAATAYGREYQLGLRIDTLAITGARPSQAVRLRVEDFHYHPVRPKLMMPKSAKGGGRNRSQKRHERYSVPITPALAVKLREAASGRNDDAPLLLQSDGSPWGSNPGQRYHRQVDNIVTAIGLDPAEVTVYALRHSSIVRMLLQNVPIRLVASLHNTSVAMIERTYSKYITEHSDDISRMALLQHEEPQTVVADNVIALAS